MSKRGETSPLYTLGFKERLCVVAGLITIVGGNWNNAGKDGALYVNLNNTASNTNTNIGAAYLIHYSVLIIKCSLFSVSLDKNELVASTR